MYLLPGVYTLVSSLSGVPQSAVTVGPPANQATNAVGAGAAAPSGLAQLQPAEQQPPPPPAYPSKTSVVAVTLPTKEAASGGQGLAGLGMGMSIGSRRGKDAADTGTAASSAAVASTGDAQGDRDGTGLLSPQGANATGAVPIGSPSNNSNHSPASKRKPLTSSFSMLGGLSLAAGGDSSSSGGVTTSRPARTFKGSTSSFIRSWEGLPVSQVMLRAIGEANAGRQTIFGFQTLGKVLLWHEISMSRKVSQPAFLPASLACPPQC